MRFFLAWFWLTNLFGGGFLDLYFFLVSHAFWGDFFGIDFWRLDLFWCLF
jgi:hypothetical protein